MLRPSIESRRSVAVAAFALLAAFAVGCAGEEGDVEDAPVDPQAQTVDDVTLESSDVGVDRALISCSGAKPYPRCNVFGRCRCSAYP